MVSSASGGFRGYCGIGQKFAPTLWTLREERRVTSVTGKAVTVQYRPVHYRLTSAPYTLRWLQPTPRKPTSEEESAQPHRPVVEKGGNLPPT
jgi:hypothetical protein